MALADALTGQDTYGAMNYPLPGADAPVAPPLTPEQQLLHYSQGLGGGSMAAPGGTYPLPDLNKFYGALAGTAPPGTYDPQLDYQLLNARSGLAQKLQDLATAQQRRQDQLNIYTVPGFEHQYATQLADVTRQHGYTTQDIGTQRQAAGVGLGRRLADYQTSIANTQRNFANQGQQQAQSAEAMGTGDGGTLAQALVNRGVNEQAALQPMQTGIGRANEDYQTQLAGLNTQQQRADEAYNTMAGPNSGNPYDSNGRLAWALANNVGQASAHYGQQGQDAALEAQRASDQMNQFMLGVGAEAQLESGITKQDKTQTPTSGALSTAPISF